MLFPSSPLQLVPDVWLLQGYASTRSLLIQIESIAAQAEFRHYTVPGGKSMAVATTCCGSLGWTSDAQGYAYLPHDPRNGNAWPKMPGEFEKLAREAANACGWPAFAPDSCLINRYAGGAGMGLHQDRNERDLSAPIVSVSIGASAKFMLGGLRRDETVKSIDLHDGDVTVWGAAARLVFHGVRPLPQNAGIRYNLTFRKAG